MRLNNIGEFSDAEVTRALIIIASRLKTGSALVIHPFDIYTDTVMVEGIGTDVEDVRVRQKITDTLLKHDPEAGAQVIDELMNHVEILEDQVNDYNNAKNKERRRLREEDEL